MTAARTAVDSQLLGRLPPANVEVDFLNIAGGEDLPPATKAKRGKRQVFAQSRRILNALMHDLGRLLVCWRARMLACLLVFACVVCFLACLFVWMCLCLIGLSVCLPVCLPVCLFVRLSVCLSVCLLVCLFGLLVCLFACLLLVCLFACLLVCLCVCVLCFLVFLFSLVVCLWDEGSAMPRRCHGLEN